MPFFALANWNWGGRLHPLYYNLSITTKALLGLSIMICRLLYDRSWNPKLLQNHSKLILKLTQIDSKFIPKRLQADPKSFRKRLSTPASRKVCQLPVDQDFLSWPTCLDLPGQAQYAKHSLSTGASREAPVDKRSHLALLPRLAQPGSQ